MAVNTRSQRFGGKYSRNRDRSARRVARRRRYKALMLEYLERREMLDGSGVEELLEADPKAQLDQSLRAASEAYDTATANATVTHSNQEQTAWDAAKAAEHARPQDQGATVPLDLESDASSQSAVAAALANYQAAVQAASDQYDSATASADADIVGMVVGSRFRFCFVAGTQVLMADDESDALYAATDAAFTEPTDTGSASLDYTKLALGVGSIAMAVAGRHALRLRRESDEWSRYQRGVDSLFDNGTWDDSTFAMDEEQDFPRRANEALPLAPDEDGLVAA